jgi:hypothetical protein
MITPNNPNYEGNSERSSGTDDDKLYIGRLALVSVMAVGSVFLGVRAYQEVAEMSDPSYDISILED